MRLLLSVLCGACLVASAPTPAPVDSEVSVMTGDELLSALASPSVVLIRLLADVKLSQDSAVPGADPASGVYRFTRNVTVASPAGSSGPDDWFPILDLGYIGARFEIPAGLTWQLQHLLVRHLSRQLGSYDTDIVAPSSLGTLLFVDCVHVTEACAPLALTLVNLNTQASRPAWIPGTQNATLMKPSGWCAPPQPPTSGPDSASPAECWATTFIIHDVALNLSTFDLAFNTTNTNLYIGRALNEVVLCDMMIEDQCIAHYGGLTQCWAALIALAVVANSLPSPAPLPAFAPPVFSPPPPLAPSALPPPPLPGGANPLAPNHYKVPSPPLGPAAGAGGGSGSSSNSSSSSSLPTWAIGLMVGLAVPAVLLVAAAVVWLLLRRRRRQQQRQRKSRSQPPHEASNSLHEAFKGAAVSLNSDSFRKDSVLRTTQLPDSSSSDMRYDSVSQETLTFTMDWGGSPGCNMYAALQRSAAPAQQLPPPRVDPGELVSEMTTKNALMRDEQLELIRVLGRGGGGIVYQGLWKGLPVAAKVMIVHEEQHDQARRQILEATMSTSLSHPNIVITYNYDLRRMAASCGAADEHSVVGQATFATAWQLVILQELCKGGAMKQLVDHNILSLRGDQPALDLLKMQHVLMLAHDISSGLEHLHLKNVVHSDMTANNVLLQTSDVTRPAGLKWIAKVADFGLSVAFEDGCSHVSRMFAGTPHYIAPETQTRGVVSKCSDVFAFGVLLYELVAGAAVASSRSNNKKASPPHPAKPPPPPAHHYHDDHQRSAPSPPHPPASAAAPEAQRADEGAQCDQAEAGVPPVCGNARHEYKKAVQQDGSAAVREGRAAVQQGGGAAVHEGRETVQQVGGATVHSSSRQPAQLDLPAASTSSDDQDFVGRAGSPQLHPPSAATASSGGEVIRSAGSAQLQPPAAIIVSVDQDTVRRTGSAVGSSTPNDLALNVDLPSSATAAAAVAAAAAVGPPPPRTLGAAILGMATRAVRGSGTTAAAPTAASTADGAVAANVTATADGAAAAFERQDGGEPIVMLEMMEDSIERSYTSFPMQSSVPAPHVPPPHVPPPHVPPAFPRPLMGGGRGHHGGCIELRPLPPCCPIEYVALVEACLSPEPQERPTITEVRTRLCHMLGQYVLPDLLGPSSGESWGSSR